MTLIDLIEKYMNTKRDFIETEEIVQDLVNLYKESYNENQDT